MPLACALIHEDGGRFGISFPDFPGAATSGRDAEEAIRKGAELLTFHVAGMVEDGDRLPILRSVAELRADPEFTEDADGAVLAFVSFDLPTRSVRVNITMDEALLRAVDDAAQAGGQSRSAYLADAARARIRAA
jgi:predicted RNase H-like HicB family nuclease